MEVVSRPDPLLPPPEGRPKVYAAEQETGWSPEPVWIPWIRERKVFSLPGIQTQFLSNSAKSLYWLSYLTNI
jgi:hypothetical protein